MTRITFKDLPDRTTPINATNLNKLNNVSIGTSTPTLNEELWVKSSNKENILTSSIMSKNTTTYAGLTLTKISDTKWKLNGTNTESTDWNFNFTISNGNLGKKCIVYLKTSITNIKFQIDSIYNYNQKALIENTIPAFGIRVLGGATYNNAEIEVVIEEYSLSETYTNINGTYKKYTDTVSVGIDSNNAGLWVQHSKNYLSINDITGDQMIFEKLPISLPKGTYTFTYTASINSGATQLNIYNGDTSIHEITSNNGGKIVKTFTLDQNATSVSLYANSQGRYYDMQIARGNDSNFEPHTDTSIKVNNNGVYETIANKNVYSSSEVVIGEWLGKPLYRKILDLGSTLIFVSTNWYASGYVSDEIGQIVNCIGYQPNGIMPRIMAVMMQNSLQLMNPYAFEVQLRYLILEYTKTTD